MYKEALWRGEENNVISALQLLTSPNATCKSFI